MAGEHEEDDRGAAGPAEAGAGVIEGHDTAVPRAAASRREKEIGGREGPDPTRYGDWEKAGRCIDF